MKTNIRINTFFWKEGSLSLALAPRSLLPLLTNYTVYHLWHR